MMSFIARHRRLVRVLAWIEGLGLLQYAAGIHGVATRMVLEAGAWRESVRGYERVARRGNMLVLEYVVRRADAEGRTLARRPAWIELPLDGIVGGDVERTRRESRHPASDPFRDGDRAVPVMTDEASTASYVRDVAPTIAHCEVPDFVSVGEDRRPSCPRAVAALGDADLECAKVYYGTLLVVGCETPRMWLYRIPGPSLLVPGWKGDPRMLDARDAPAWWSWPVRIVGFPVAVAVDLATIPITIVVLLRAIAGFGGP